jgi:Uma2 family endonuclease
MRRSIRPGYTSLMAVALLKEPPLSPYTDLGPYRRKDYEALPDEPRCELIFGRFYVSPSPSVGHQVVTGLLYQHLHVIAKEMEGEAFIAPVEIPFADHSLVQPDVIYVSPERRGSQGAPDLVVEVVSPGGNRLDRCEKLALYAKTGIREYWIADVPERHITFLVNQGGRFSVALYKGAEYRSCVLPEIHLDIPAFWKEVEDRLGPS